MEKYLRYLILSTNKEKYESECSKKLIFWWKYTVNNIAIILYVEVVTIVTSNNVSTQRFYCI